jgi:hypothetical protein
MRNSKIAIFSLILLTLVIFLTSCGKTYKPRIKYKADVSDIKTDIDIIRFDLDFLSLDTTNISQGLEKLKEKHGDFVKTFLIELLNDGGPQPMEEVAKAFLSFPETKQLGDTIRKIFPDLKFAEKEIENILRYKIHFFGEKLLPINKVYTFHTLYKYGAFTYDNIAGLGLDFFLGESHVGYQAVESLRHQYKKRTLNKTHMSAAIAAAIAEFVVSESTKPGGSKMIDIMLYEGKKFFVKGCLMPEIPDSIIYNFSDYQIKYCELGETALWEHLGKENLIFSSKKTDYQKYVAEGPFNPQTDLPGNSGSWLGAQIIMQNANRMRRELKAADPKLSAREIDRKVMQAILKETDSQFFIQKYKPTK